MHRLRSPFVWMAIGAIVTLVPLVPTHGPGWMVSLIGLCLFSVANPLTCALGDHWWRDTVLSAVAWGAIFAAIGALPGLKTLGEGAMVYLLPVMIYPVAVAISGVIRLIRVSASRTRAAQPGPPGSPHAAGDEQR